MIGFTLLSAFSQMQSAKAQAKAITQEGALNAANKARETRIKAARVKSSFLSSGLELEGTPMSAISDTFNVGIADTSQIIKNANFQSRNTMSQARSKVIGDMAQSFGMAAMGGGMDLGGGGASTFGSQGALSRGVAFGDTSVQGPLQSWGNI